MWGFQAYEVDGRDYVVKVIVFIRAGEINDIYEVMTVTWSAGYMI